MNLPLNHNKAIRILVIDDDDVDRLRVRRFLSNSTYGVFTIEEAVDAAAGIAAIAANHFDCVLLDFKLPDEDGLSLLRRIEAAKGETPPIILQTTLDDTETALETLSAGAQDYLVKGHFDGPLLVRAIRYAVERDRLTKERNRLHADLNRAQETIKTLEGILPICAKCKKIRDPQNQWHHMEKYISEHSKVSFSHGICPNCIRELYPEFIDQPPATEPQNP